MDSIRKNCDIREESRFFAQILITIIVIIASIVNLTIGTEDKVLWVSLLSSCVGLAFPGLNTERKRKDNNNNNNNNNFIELGDCVDGKSQPTSRKNS